MPTTADNHFLFTLPSPSYVDISPDEQTRIEDMRAGGFVDWLAGRVAAFRARQVQRRALAELSGMTDRELTDIGLNRGDFMRMFGDASVDDLRTRGERV